MFSFLLDFLKYPFDSHPENNKFHQFLTMILKDYPAFFWQKPSWKRVLVFPFLLIYAIFKNKKVK